MAEENKGENKGEKKAELKGWEAYSCPGRGLQWQIDPKNCSYRRTDNTCIAIRERTVCEYRVYKETEHKTFEKEEIK